MLGLLATGIAGGIAACTRPAPTPNGTVVLYSSVDDEYLRLIVDKFEKSTGIRVLVKGDTEATKTTGLAERLRAEHAAGKPGADVWWSSEPFLTIALADEGVLTPMADKVFGDLPKEHWGEGNLWGTFANRARVVVRRGSIDIGHADFMSADFTQSGPAIARPAFGTTRGHFGWVLATVGEDCFARWVRALREGGAKIVDGNSAVVRLVASGEAKYGLTDTDDVWSGQTQDWTVQCDRAVIRSRMKCLDDSPAAGTFSGPMMIPNSVALVKGGANPGNAAALTRFIMSEESERTLMHSNSHNMPVRPALLDEMLQSPSGRYVVERAAASREVPEAGGRKPKYDGPPIIPLALRQIAAAAPRAVELARAEGLA